MITFDDFEKIELRVGIILAAERVSSSDKLIRVELDMGPTDQEGESEWRQVVAGIGKWYEPETLVGKRVVVVCNLEPRELMGIESQGMLLAAKDGEGRLSLLSTLNEVGPGATIS
jgi:methionyl-tRNA synthetase